MILTFLHRTFSGRGWIGQFCTRGAVALLACTASLPWAAAQSASWTLVPSPQVDGQGIFFYQLVARRTDQPPPHFRVADAPRFGQAVQLKRRDIQMALAAHVPGSASNRFDGPDVLRVTRRSRLFTETELKGKLTSLLQHDHVRDQGELELRLTRPWTSISVPDDTLSIKILDLPTTGVSSSFVLRFELSAGGEILGVHHVALQARIWKEIWTAASALPRGQLLTEAHVVRERRDLLAVREKALDTPVISPALETAQTIPAGVPILARLVRVRPVVHRGQVLDAQLHQGTVLISLKVEVLEEGGPGDTVRIRNVQSRREFRGKVQDEQTIQVYL